MDRMKDSGSFDKGSIPFGRTSFSDTGRIALVIFDFDGTLADTQCAIVRTMQQTMSALHLPVLDAARCASVIGLELQDAFRELFPQHGVPTAARCVDTYRRLFAENRKTLIPSWFPHVPQVLRWLHQCGCPAAIATSRSSVSLRQLLDDMDEVPPFRCLVGGDDVLHHKPDAEAVLRILADTGTEAADTLVVGDAAVDILMGRAAGAHTCGVTYGNAGREKLMQAGAEHIIDDISSLPELIHNIK